MAFENWCEVHFKAGKAFVFSWALVHDQSATIWGKVKRHEHVTKPMDAYDTDADAAVQHLMYHPACTGK
eukprot:5426682-Pyramimonas_sp.AAC.1